MHACVLDQNNQVLYHLRLTSTKEVKSNYSTSWRLLLPPSNLSRAAQYNFRALSQYSRKTHGKCDLSQCKEWEN